MDESVMNMIDECERVCDDNNYESMNDSGRCSWCVNGCLWVQCAIQNVLMVSREATGMKE
jgi:hypothetical protein